MQAAGLQGDLAVGDHAVQGEVETELLVLVFQGAEEGAVGIRTGRQAEDVVRLQTIGVFAAIGRVARGGRIGRAPVDLQPVQRHRQHEDVTARQLVRVHLLLDPVQALEAADQAGVGREQAALDQGLLARLAQQQGGQLQLMVLVELDAEGAQGVEGVFLFGALETASRRVRQAAGAVAGFGADLVVDAAVDLEGVAHALAVADLIAVVERDEAAQAHAVRQVDDLGARQVEAEVRQVLVAVDRPDVAQRTARRLQHGRVVGEGLQRGVDGDELGQVQTVVGDADVRQLAARIPVEAFLAGRFRLGADRGAEGQEAFIGNGARRQGDQTAAELARILGRIGLLDLGVRDQRGREQVQGHHALQRLGAGQGRAVQHDAGIAIAQAAHIDIAVADDGQAGDAGQGLADLRVARALDVFLGQDVGDRRGLALHVRHEAAAHDDVLDRRDGFRVLRRGDRGRGVLGPGDSGGGQNRAGEQAGEADRAGRRHLKKSFGASAGEKEERRDGGRLISRPPLKDRSDP